MGLLIVARDIAVAVLLLAGWFGFWFASVRVLKRYIGTGAALISYPIL